MINSPLEKPTCFGFEYNDRYIGCRDCMWQYECRKLTYGVLDDSVDKMDIEDEWDTFEKDQLVNEPEF